MPTLRQKRVARKIIESANLDNPPSGGEILESIGYSKAIAKNPKMILESVGVKEALNDLGFSEEGAKQVVKEILYDKKVDPTARLNAADKVFKVQGSYAPEKKLNVNIEAQVTPEIKELAEKLNALYRDGSPGVVSDTDK